LAQISRFCEIRLQCFSCYLFAPFWIDPIAGSVTFPGCPLAQRLERRADLGREQLGFFPGGEVTAPVSLVKVAEGGVA